MFPFWDIAIAPVIEAAGAKRIVEIGALRGETTVLLLDRLGPDSEIHVIDPMPEFDPAEHERAFPGRYIFYRDISHNVLPSLPPVDVALVDGDHNWYTVYHELKMLAATAREAGTPLPVLIMHDVLWPYGRRDLYYAPERIPEEFRHPYANRGMQPRRQDLLPEGRGGLSPTMNNAILEGGPRNGVMTALDDFEAEHGRPLRRVLLPIYFGLAIVVEEERLARAPELAAMLDHLESAEMRNELMALAESLRIRALIFQHGIFYGQMPKLEAAVERGARRYLDLLRGAVLDEHFLENEVRIDYLVSCARSGTAPDEGKLHDPARQLRNELHTLRHARHAGLVAATNGSTPYYPYTAMGRGRLEHLERCLETVRSEKVPGDLMECGVGRGGGGIFMRGFLAAHEVEDRCVWAADPFRGLAGGEAGVEPAVNRAPSTAGDLNIVRDGYARFGLLDGQVRFLQGPYRATLADAPVSRIAVLRIDTNAYQSTRDVLELCYDRVAAGGFVIVDDYSSPDCRKAVDEFRAERSIADPIERIDWVGVSWRKSEQATAGEVARPVGLADRAPLAPPPPTDRVDLSVIVCFYNMRREAERTLHSLSRAYQWCIDDLSYEVVVVENGSADEQALGADYVQSFGPEFRYLDLGAEATPTPAHALNRGLELARGENIALMIDGAHVLTPGVLHHGMVGLRTYGTAIVATQQWYVGPGQQPDAVRQGYDQEYEDRLFRQIKWPTDGYKLFDIGHFIGERDWLDGVWESNCIFVPRAILQQVGAMDETFSIPGGGFANLDFYERVGATPDLTVVTILGEGSFHQVHGGTTTNESEVDDRNPMLISYRRDYADIRGRLFRGPGKPIHYVGSMIDAARRTRARRMVAPGFFKKIQVDDPDGIPNDPIAIPDELKLEFTDFFWRSYLWRDAKWLGREVKKCPTDLFAYQELVTRVGPDWIIETNSGGGGRALFFASICELLDHGRVISITNGASAPVDNLPAHPRITYLDGDAVDPEIVAQVRELVGEPPNALVVLGLASRPRVLDMFNAYAPLVPLGSYVVVEDTIMNGHPVWPGMGPGPAEAVKEIVQGGDEFAPDGSMEKYALTFNAGGFLKRVR